MGKKTGFVTEDPEKKFASDPKIIENRSLLREIGVFSYIEELSREIRNYQTLLSRGLDILNRTTID